MTEFLKIVRKVDRTLDKKTLKKLKDSWSWAPYFRRLDNDQEMEFVRVDAFSTNLNANFNDAFKEGTVLEVTLHDYDKICDDVECRWFARVEKVGGFRVCCEYVGTTTKFWIHLLSADVHCFADAPLTDPTMSAVSYVPPVSINMEFRNDMQNFIRNTIDGEVIGQLSLSELFEENRKSLETPRFKKGQRLELLNYTNSTEIRVARIQETCGRRINVLVEQQDYPEQLEEPDQDRQAQNPGAQYWIDQESFFIFPVGFAAYNGYGLKAKKQYIEHTKRIAESLNKGETPKYANEDITFADLAQDPVDPDDWKNVKVGQKFELIDPLAQQFNNVHVASVMEFCKTSGYLIVGMDGPDQKEESFPIHINNSFMFPVGYASKYNLKLMKPDGHKGSFKWDEYLKKEGAEKLPLDLFKPMPPKERLDKFKVGMHLEAADMCENQFICPGTIKSVHGRVINVNFDGWTEEFDELYDIDSHDILPAGWCELHGYVLQPPKRYDN